MSFELCHRFGGHVDGGTEWEITSHDLGTQKYMRTLSEERWLKAWVGDSTLDRWEERYACGLYLKEGTPFDVATRLVLLLMGAEEER
jgi:hypothetical protein